MQRSVPLLQSYVKGKPNINIKHRNKERLAAVSMFSIYNGNEVGLSSKSVSSTHFRTRPFKYRNFGTSANITVTNNKKPNHRRNYFRSSMDEPREIEKLNLNEVQLMPM